MSSPDLTQLKKSALAIRKKILEMHYHAKSSHLGTALSEIDLLTYLFGYFLAPHDRFVLSKGHGASGAYATLDHFSKMPKGMIETYYRDGTKLAAHPSPLALEHMPLATGSLGHGLSVATGMALGSRLAKTNKKVACLISDGELNEGSIWEAALFSGHHKLSNLTVLVDFNGLQGFGKTSDVLNPEPVVQKWESFGFETFRIDGHNFEKIHSAFTQARREKPLCIIAETVKGKGVSFMENTLDWHYLNLNAELFEKAMSEMEHA
jgi:transketolase